MTDCGIELDGWSTEGVLKREVHLNRALLTLIECDVSCIIYSERVSVAGGLTA